MEIRATSQCDLNSCKAVMRLGMFKKANPQKRMILWTAVYVLLFSVLIWEMVVFGINTHLIVMLLVCVGVMSLMYFLYFFFPKLQYKSMVNLKDAVNEYVFCDTVLKIFTKNDLYNGEAEIEYSLFVKVYETSTYFFLYQTKNQVYIVDKLTLEGGTAEDVRNRLRNAVKEKYVICKY